MANHVIAGADAPPINQRQRALALHAAQRQRLAPAHLPPLKGHPRRAAHGIEQVGRIALGQLLLGHHRHTGGRGAGLLLGHGGRHRDGLQGVLPSRGSGQQGIVSRRGGLGQTEH